ncbi:MAG: hypothetical protein ACLVB1_03825 [Blautia obeum]
MASSGVKFREAARNALSDKIQYLTEFLGGEYEIQALTLHGSIAKNLHFATKWLKYMKPCGRNQNCSYSCRS